MAKKEQQYQQVNLVCYLVEYLYTFLMRGRRAFSHGVLWVHFLSQALSKIGQLEVQLETSLANEEHLTELNLNLQEFLSAAEIKLGDVTTNTSAEEALEATKSEEDGGEDAAGEVVVKVDEPGKNDVLAEARNHDLIKEVRIMELRNRNITIMVPTTHHNRSTRVQTQALPPHPPQEQNLLLTVTVSETFELVFAEGEMRVDYQEYRNGILEYPRDCGGVRVATLREDIRGSVPEDWMWLKDLGFYNPNSDVWPDSRGLLFRSAGDVQRFITRFPRP